MNVKTIKELIRNQKELALMNGVQLTSWEALRAGIVSTTKAMLKWLVTNPAGWVILATTAITGLVKGYDALIGRQEKLARTNIEDLDKDITKYDEEIKALEELQSKLESAKGNKSELAHIQNELNDAIGETTGLLNGEGKAYDIANAKLKANIELKKQQREQAQKDRIKEKKNLFDDNVYEDGSSWFNTNADSMRLYAQKYQELIKEYENALDDSDIKKMYGSAEDYAFGWLNVNASAGIKESTWADYWDEQVQTAYDIFEDTIEDYDGVGGQDFIKNIINNMVRGGSDLSQISDVIFDIINNQDLQDKINEYWASLVDPEIDSEKALNAVKTMIDGIIKQYPQLEAFFTDFYDGIVSGANVVADTVTDTANKIDVSLDSYKKASEGISSLATAFKELTDSEYVSLETISKIKEAVGDSVSNWDTYEQKLLSVKKGTSEYSQLMSELTYATIEKQLGGVNALAQADEKYVAQLLKENGVLNANEVAHSAVEKAKAENKFETYKQTNSIESLIDALGDENTSTEDTIATLTTQAGACKVSTNAYLELLAKEIAFGNNDLDVSQKVSALNKIAKAAGVAAIAMQSATNGSTNLTGKQKTDLANELGIKVQDTGKTVYDKSLGKKVADWEYYYGGQWYTKFSDAEYAARQDKYIEDLNNRLSDIDITTPDYSGAKTTSKDTKETFDWIETKISRLQRSITNFGKTVSATWKSWTDRNSALKSQISAVTSEINLQANAANKYLSLANSVGLGEGYKSLVRNGSLNISTIKDENTINAIKKYQEYYENYLSALDAKQDAENELANLVREDFDMIAKQFDSEMSLVEANMGIIEAYIDQTEMKGNLVSKNYYSAMYAEEQKNLSLLQQKYDQLSNKLSNGTVKQGSEEFNEMAKEIKEVSKAIIESNTAIEEYQKTMRELDWEVFDLIEEKIGNVTEESEFLIDLLSNSKLFNDDGSITSQGQATLGLHVANMKVYESQIKDYADEIARLDEEFANDSLDQNYLERREELVELQRDSILAMQDEKQSIKDLMSEGYDSLLSYMDEVINKRKELFSQTSDARSFQKTVQEQTDEITRLQNILNSYNGDLSEEAKAAVQKYEIELKDAESNLEDTLYDKYISDQEQMLDALADDTEQWVNERLDNINGLIEDVITSTDANADTIKTTLETEVKGVGGTLTTQMQNLWSGADGVKGVVGGVNNTLLEIKNLVQSMVKASDTEASKNASGATTNATPATKPATTPQSTPATTQQSSTKAITVGGMINASGALIYDYAGDTSGERQYYRNSPYYRVLSEKNGYLKVRHQSLSSGTTGWFKKSDVKAYKTGGLVDYTGLAWVDGQKGKPEAFLNENQTELFAKLKDSLETVSKTNMFDAIQNYAKMPNFVGGTSNRNITNHNTFEFNMPNVKDADDFITDLQHSKRFENIVLEITDGKGDLSKYKW